MEKEAKLSNLLKRKYDLQIELERLSVRQSFIVTELNKTEKEISTAILGDDIAVLLRNIYEVEKAKNS